MSDRVDQALDAPAVDGRARSDGRFSLFLVCICLVIGLVAILTRESNLWISILMLLVPMSGAFLVSRRSKVAIVALGYIAIAFGLTSLLVGAEHRSETVALVVIWSIGFTAGIFLGSLHRSPRKSQPPLKTAAPLLPHFVLTIALILLSLVLNLTGVTGYSAQIATGTSAPSGVLTSLASAAPLASIVLVGIAVSSNRYVLGALFVAALETLVLTQSGFRGAGVAFILAGLSVAWVALPADSVWRRGRRMAGVTAVAIAAMVAVFVLGAMNRQQSIAEATFGTEGLSLAASTNVSDLVQRLDYGNYLETALDYQFDEGVGQAVHWTGQLIAVVPKALWPDKPTISYGTDLTTALTGLPSYSASSISAIGDTFINYSALGVLVVSCLLGVWLAFIEGGFRRRGGVVRLVLLAATAEVALRQEAAVLLSVVGALRSILIVAALWLLAEGVARGIGSRQAHDAQLREGSGMSSPAKVTIRSVAKREPQGTSLR